MNNSPQGMEGRANTPPTLQCSTRLQLQTDVCQLLQRVWAKKKYMKSFGNWIIRKEIIFTPSTRAELSHSVAARKTISWFDNSQSISDSLLNIEEIKLRWIFFFTTLGNIKKGVYSLHSGILNKAAENDAIAKQAPNVNSLTLQRKLKRCGLFIRKDSQLCLWSWYSISV